MFIDKLKELVTTLVIILIFISAVQLISPNNKMKKYIKFILGLILITVILNPILKFISNGEENIVRSIDKYQQLFSENKTDSNNIKYQENQNDFRKNAFIKNFNKNCDDLLKKKYKDMNFKSQVDCDVDFDNMKIDVKKLIIAIADDNIKKIKKVNIDLNKNVDTKENNDEYKQIIEFISTELDIPKDKIEVYKLD